MTILKKIVSASNPDLVLALAACVEGDEFHIGEVLEFHPYGIYAAKKGDLCVVTKLADDFVHVKWISETSQNDGGYTYSDFKKADKNTIISHFAKQEKTKDMAVDLGKPFNGKKITGYKFKPGYEKFRLAAERIMGMQGGETLTVEYFLRLENLGEFYNNLKDAGVLDLWFEPVYEEEKKTITVRSEGGSFEVTISKEILFEGKGVSIDLLKDLREKNSNFKPISGWYICASHFNIGCKKSIPYEDIRKVIEDYNKINNVFDDFDLPF